MNKFSTNDVLSDEADSQQLRLLPVMPSLVHGSLFSGIGGFDLAAEWMGWENAFHCEWNSFGQRILKHYWPGATSYEDITKTDFTIWRGRIDILTGGFPCQPYSSAGKRKGKEDERHLWPEMLRAIREIQPRFVVGENVRGLTNWNGGLVFDEVQADLENEGYEVTPFLLPACAVDAPHRRDRIWFIAYSSNNGYESGRFRKNRPTQSKSQSIEEERQRIWNDDRRIIKQRLTSNTAIERLQRSLCGNTKLSTQQFEKGFTSNSNSGRQSGKEHRQTEPGRTSEASIPSDWENFPTQSPVCDGNDGFSSRLDGITFPKWRNESIKAAGNAIVPQIAFQIFKAVGQYVQLTSEA